MALLNGTIKNGHKGLAPSENEDSSSSLLITIGDPEPSPPKFPKEPNKLFISWLFLFLSTYSNDLVLSWIHDRLPETHPLPDLFFSIFPHWPGALAISEYLIITSTVTMFTTCFLHKYRWILLRRVFTVTGLLYFLRAFCMLVTQVPVADTTYYCSPKNNNTGFGIVFVRSIQLMSGGGLQINGKHTYCGDYIYSGHTLVLVLTYLVVREYSPRRYWILHWLVWLLSASGIFCILLSRGHYTVDVIIAYYITTRLFWLYHTMANNQNLKEYSVTNLLTREFWFPLFFYMERNVGAVVPRRFEWPFSWPRFLARPNSASSLAEYSSYDFYRNE